MTKGRTVFGVGRGYHTREVETFGAPIIDQDANRELFEEQVEIIFKAFDNERFSHQGKHYTLPPEVPYRGYTLKELTLVPRPIHRPVEMLAAGGQRQRARAGFHGEARHQGRGGRRRGDDAGRGRSPLISDAAQRAGKDLKLGENLMIGIFVHLADTQAKALKEITPLYEEHAKMFAPLGFLPGVTQAQIAAIAQRGGWYEAGVPTVEHYMKMGAWFAGHAGGTGGVSAGAGGALSGPGAHQSLSTPIGTPLAIMQEQFGWIAQAVMPAFQGRARVEFHVTRLVSLARRSCVAATLIPSASRGP